MKDHGTHKIFSNKILQQWERFQILFLNALYIIFLPKKLLPQQLFKVHLYPDERDCVFGNHNHSTQQRAFVFSLWNVTWNHVLGLGGSTALFLLFLCRNLFRSLVLFSWRMANLVWIRHYNLQIPLNWAYVRVSLLQSVAKWATECAPLQSWLEGASAPPSRYWLMHGDMISQEGVHNICVLTITTAEVLSYF